MIAVEQEAKRKRDIYENVTILHMLCMYIMLFALVVNNKFFSINIFPFINYKVLIFMVGCLLLFVLVNLYNRRYYYQVEEKRFTLVGISYIGYPLLIAIIIFHMSQNSSTHYPEVMFLLPVIIAASIGGQLLGMAMAALCGAIVLYYGYFEQGKLIYGLVESHLIFLGILFVVGWFIGSQTDSEKEHRSYLTKLATTDLLTGLFSHRYFQDKLQEYFQNPDPKEPLVLILLDIDYFKYYNDSFGHLMGDKLLQIIAGFLHGLNLKNAFAARYAGGQFALVLQGYDQNDALKIAEDIISKINEYHFYGEKYQPEGKITVSCGIALYPQHANNSKELQGYAEQALYKSRSLSRHNVELYFSVFDNMEISNDEREILNSIRTLVSVINAKDRYTYGHSERVTYYGHKMAELIGLSEEEIKWVDYASFLHDIGKIEIDRDILNKPSSLSEEEWLVIKQHPIWGSDMVKPLAKLRPIVPIIRHHHENYDGSGYPDGLAGDDIPVISRIIRIVDSYDAMTSYRPYRRNLSSSEALAEIKYYTGIMFDPELVDSFETILEEDLKERAI